MGGDGVKGGGGLRNLFTSLRNRISTTSKKSKKSQPKKTDSTKFRHSQPPEKTNLSNNTKSNEIFSSYKQPEQYKNYFSSINNLNKSRQSLSDSSVQNENGPIRKNIARDKKPTDPTSSNRKKIVDKNQRRPTQHRSGEPSWLTSQNSNRHSRYTSGSISELYEQSISNVSDIFEVPDGYGTTETNRHTRMVTPFDTSKVPMSGGQEIEYSALNSNCDEDDLFNRNSVSFDDSNNPTDDDSDMDVISPHTSPLGDSEELERSTQSRRRNSVTLSNLPTLPPIGKRNSVTLSQREGILGSGNSPDFSLQNEKVEDNSNKKPPISFVDSPQDKTRRSIELDPQLLKQQSLQYDINNQPPVVSGAPAVLSKLANKQAFETEDVLSLTDELFSFISKGEVFTQTQERDLGRALTLCVDFATSEIDRKASREEQTRQLDDRALAKDVLVSLMYHPNHGVRKLADKVFPRLYGRAPKEIGEACAELMHRFDPGLAADTIASHRESIRDYLQELAPKNLEPRLEDQKETRSAYLQKLVESRDPILRMALQRGVGTLAKNELEESKVDILARAQRQIKESVDSYGSLQLDEDCKNLLAENIVPLLQSVDKVLGKFQESMGKPVGNDQGKPVEDHEFDYLVSPIYSYAIRSARQDQPDTDPCKKRADTLFKLTTSGEILHSNAPLAAKETYDYCAGLFRTELPHFRSTSLRLDLNQDVPEEDKKRFVTALNETLAWQDEAVGQNQARTTLVNLDAGSTLGMVNLLIDSGSCTILLDGTETEERKAGLQRLKEIVDGMQKQDSKRFSSVENMAFRSKVRLEDDKATNLAFGLWLRDYLAENGSITEQQKTGRDIALSCSSEFAKLTTDSDRIYREYELRVLAELNNQQVDRVSDR